MGINCRIAVTQPRRISATSVAERIAYERSENIGDVIGYHIRLENEVGPHSKVIFMTPGVLLRIAQDDPTFSEFTHIVIDEAHERDRYTEFLLIILRDLLALNKKKECAGASCPKLVLMSATLQTQKLSDYFGGIPHLHIGSSVHPVQQFYLEHVLHFVGFLDETSSSATKKKVGKVVKAKSKAYTCPICQSSQNFLSSEELGTHVATCFGVPSNLAADNIQSPVVMGFETYDQCADDSEQMDEEVCIDVESIEEDMDGDDVSFSLKPTDSTIASGLSGVALSVFDDGLSKHDEELLRKYQASWDDSECDYDLIESLLTYICNSEYTRNGDATILIFLPGWETISTLSRQLEGSDFFGNTKLFKIIPLHSGIPKALQREAFKPTPRGTMKIVLSTNIAETSVTIDNVTVVIDTGRSKEKGYDPHLKLSSLKEDWISQSSARQRKGRAGRTRPGVCFRLYSSRRYNSLPPYQESEMLRSSLEELALICKIMGLAPGHRNNMDDLHSFLLKAMDPPHTLSITNALDLLENIDCLDKNTGEVTPLGYVVSQFPVDPCVGRQIVMGLITGCGPNIIRVVCGMSYRDPFVMPVNENQRAKSKAMKYKLANGMPSDQLTILQALLKYNDVSSQQGHRAIQRFCDDHFLSRNVMSFLLTLSDNVAQSVQLGVGINPHSRLFSENNDDFLLLQSLIGIGLYPNIAVRKKNNSSFVTEKGRKGKVHPSSLNNTNSNKSISNFSSQCKKELEVIGFQDLVAFTSRGKESHIGGATVQMLSTSPVSVFVLCIACGSFARNSPSAGVNGVNEGTEDKIEFIEDPDDKTEGIILCLIDDWLPLRMYEETFQLICDVRECLNDSISCFLQACRNGRYSSSKEVNLPAHVSAFKDAIAEALIYECQASMQPPGTDVEREPKPLSRDGKTSQNNNRKSGNHTIDSISKNKKENTSKKVK